MVQAALTAVDVEVRPLLLNNIVLTGGGSLLDKLAERLHSELSALYPNPRVRVNASNLVTDRKYGSWVGGSILASLGTFHQVSFECIKALKRIYVDPNRCGSPRRSTKSTALASSRSDANNETWSMGKGVLRHIIAGQNGDCVGRTQRYQTDRDANEGSITHEECHTFLTMLTLDVSYHMQVFGELD